MNREQDLRRLAARANGGDSSAVAELHDELADHMTRIVRRALRPGARLTPVTQRVLNEADRLQDWRDGNQEGFVSLVAGRLCESVVGGLRAGPGWGLPSRDTVRN